MSGLAATANAMPAIKALSRPAPALDKNYLENSRALSFDELRTIPMVGEWTRGASRGTILEIPPVETGDNNIIFPEMLPW